MELTPHRGLTTSGKAISPRKRAVRAAARRPTRMSSAARISESELAKFGLYRPFDPSDNPDNTEVNHVQLLPSSGPVSLTDATATWQLDPA